MENRRGRGRGPEDWEEEDWPGSDWARDERIPPRRAGGPRDRARDGRVPCGEVDIDPDLGRVVDDPLFDALPGGVPVRETIRVGGRRAMGSITGRRAPTRMSLGQKIVLWLGLVVVAAASFAAGLVVGASGGIEVPAIPFLRPKEAETVAVKPLGGEEANQPAEGVIAFSNHGQVPPKVEEGAEPPAKPKPTSELPAAPVQAKEGKPPAEAQAKGAPKPPTEREAEPARRASAEKGSAGPEKEGSEMTFYDTATGKREVPGLGAPSGSEDSEAGPAKPEETAPAAEASGPPLGADLLARHRAEKAAPPPKPSGEATGGPSGEDLLARHHAGPGGGNVVAPRPSNTYAVQVATMADRAAARALAERLAAKGFDVRIDSLTGATGTTLYVVRVGRYGSEQEAQRDLDRLKNEPGTSPFIKMN